MGPTASQHAHHLLLDKCSESGAKNNDDYPTIIHISINTTDFINGNNDDAEMGFNYIKQKLLVVNMDLIDIGFIACNTAHIFFDRINHLCKNKLISIVDIIPTHIKTKNTGIICSPFSATNNIFNYPNLIFPDNLELKNLNLIIRKVIANRIDKNVLKDFRNIIQSMKNRSCKQIIIGCSELSILVSMIQTEYDPEFFIDPINLAIEKIVYEQ